MIVVLVRGAGSDPAMAEVAVLSNRTTSLQTVELFRAEEPNENLTIRSGESRPVFFSRSLRVRYGEGFSRHDKVLASGSAYFLASGGGGEKLRLEKIGLGLRDFLDAPASQSRPSTALVETAISVKILVDDDEPTHRELWESRLRKRVADASAILERHSGIALRVVAVSTWESDDSQHDFRRAMREFEQKVDPGPAVLAIGFSSQYQIAHGRVHLGGTRGPLHPYILLKERARRVRETERLELLVHELGHYLGASHSPEPESVMRPVLTGGQQRHAGARIQFDPVNTLLIAMMSEEMRRYGVKRLADVSTPTKARMLEIYGALRPTLPKDPAAAQYEQLLGMSTPPSLVDDVRQVLRRIVLAARQHQREQQQVNEVDRPRQEGDQLTNLYVRQAAIAAGQIEPKHAAKAMLLALGVFMDNTGALRSFPATRGLVTRVESERERRERIAAMGAPTIRGREDLAKHFFVSAHALVVMGGEAARTAGLAKEAIDARGGTGFSFVDMAANRAGIVFAEHLLAGSLSLEEVADFFDVDDYLPEIADLDEGLQVAAMQARYGSDPKDNLIAELERIEQRVLRLPVYEGRQ